MAVELPTYSDYLAWGGKLEDEAFFGSLAAAAAHVRHAVGFNDVGSPERVGACKRAICAAVDVDHAHGATGGVGESGAGFAIGSFSMGGRGSSGSAPAASGYAADMQAAIRRELGGTGLLYQGVG